MSWKCDFCDTYNDDRTNECCVCGQPLSRTRKHTLRAEKRRRTLRRSTDFAEKAFRILRIASILLILLPLAAVCVRFILLFARNDLKELQYAFRVLGGRIGFTFRVALPERLRSLFSVSRFVLLGELAADRFRVLLDSSHSALSFLRKQRLLPFFGAAKANLLDLGVLLAALVYAVKTTVRRFLPLLSTLWRQIVSHFPLS